MQEGFLSNSVLMTATWQYMERAVGRLLQHEGYSGVRMVGQTGDEGADILAHLGGKRWLVQVKHRRSGNIGVGVMDKTVHAAGVYRANIPVIATNQGWASGVKENQATLMASGIPLQLWDRTQLISRWERLTTNPYNIPEVRTYQEKPIKNIIDAFENESVHSALVVMATGLGKTFVAAEAIKQLRSRRKGELRALILAHTNELVYQLERAFWPFIDKYILTTVWNGYEVPNHRSQLTFACVDSVANEVHNTGRFPADYDMVIIDECHHAGSPTYTELINTTECGTANGPFLLGLTATPWRADDNRVQNIFGNPVACVDIVHGLKNGWLSNVDYRMQLDNINWDELEHVHNLTPRGINRTLFISEWDDAVIYKLREIWYEIPNPRAIVFCGVIDHAITMRDRINSLGFARAEALYSGSVRAPRLSQAERNRILCDFHDGYIDVLCAVDILNEGIDLPDVNIVVFQRVTHSRRIFVQQLGRGLRIAEGKEKVIVLDFVSDIKRIAAGLDLKNQLSSPPTYISIGNQVRFMDASGENQRAESFLRQWLEDVADIEDAGEDDYVLKYPPDLSGLGEAK